MISRKYDKRIEIWQYTKIDDGFGGDIPGPDELVRKSWCQIKTAGNNARAASFLNELGITDPSSAIIVRLRQRNDTDYNAINQYLKYRGEKYIIQNAPTNINYEDVDIEIIAVKQATQSVDELIPIT